MDEQTYGPIAAIRSNNDIRTAEELEIRPYPENFEMFCYGGRIVDKQLEKEEITMRIVNGSFGFHGSEDELDDAELLLPCEVLTKNIKEAEYSVKVTYNNTDLIIEQLPQRSILIMMKKYSSDQFLKNSFRHYIEINDDMFPQQWQRTWKDNR